MHRIVHIDRIGQIEILNLFIQLGSINRFAQSVTMSVMLLRSMEGAGAEGKPTPAGERVGVSMRADKSVCCPPSLCLR